MLNLKISWIVLLIFVLILCPHERFQLTQISLKVLVRIKKRANETLILSLLKEKIRGLTSKNMEIIYTDGSVSENFTGSAFLH